MIAKIWLTYKYKIKIKMMMKNVFIYRLLANQIQAYKVKLNLKNLI